LKNILAQLLIEFGEDWDSHTELATFLYNVNYHSTIKCSPFFAVHSFKPLTPGILQWCPSDELALPEKVRRHVELLTDLQVRIRKSQTNSKRYFDKGRQAVFYVEGQLVWVRADNQKKIRVASKES